jgi:hypothetical protein
VNPAFFATGSAVVDLARSFEWDVPKGAWRVAPGSETGGLELIVYAARRRVTRSPAARRRLAGVGNRIGAAVDRMTAVPARSSRGRGGRRADSVDAGTAWTRRNRCVAMAGVASRNPIRSNFATRRG